MVDQPLTDGGERPRVLVRRRRIHQHGLAPITDNPEIATEGGVSGERLNPCAAPPRFREERMSMVGRSHRRGHRPSHDLGTWAVKILSPFGPKSSDSPRAFGHTCSPARSGHSTSRAASAAASSPNSSISDGSSIRYRSTWKIGGSSSSYGWTIAKLGLGTSPPWPSALINPRA